MRGNVVSIVGGVGWGGGATIHGMCAVSYVWAVCGHRLPVTGTTTEMEKRTRLTLPICTRTIGVDEWVPRV